MTELPLIVFDVNETLLDLETMTPFFERLFGTRLAMRLWFSNLILYSEALTLADEYVPFNEIGAAVLQMLADAERITISASDRKELTDRFAVMPPHSEVPESLSRLRAAGFRLFTLTNNLVDVQAKQLERAGIAGEFEERFSVHQVRRHKPAPETYASVEKHLGVAPSQLIMVACHTWDTLGAIAAGWDAALITRPGNELLGVGPQPTVVGEDLADVADQLIAQYR